MNKKKLAAYIAAVMGSALIAGSSAFAGSATASTSAPESSPIAFNLPTVSQWWNGNSGTANWLGLGYALQDYGLTISGSAKETYLGQATPAAYAQKSTARNYAIPTSNWGNEEKLNFTLDLGKKFGLDGVSLESDWRYREVNGSQNNPYTAQAAGTAGARNGQVTTSMFNPDKDTSGMGIRVMQQFAKWQSDASKDPQYLVKLGWINPYEDFLQQPESKNFENNAIASAKGIGSAAYGYYNPGAQGNHSPYQVTATPWSSSYETWGGTLRVKPTSATYLQSFFGAAIAGEQGVQSQDNPANGKPQGSGGAYNNHGFNFQGTAKFVTGAGTTGAQQQGKYAYGQTGVYNVNEFGWTPKFGDAKLEGHYAIGNYIWGQNNNDYGSHSGNATISGLYIQADQRLTAVQTAAPAAPSLSKNPVDSKNPVAAAPAAYDKTRGLYSFTEATYTPADCSSMPFYFQTGLVYKGLFDARKNDKTGVAWGEGFYSQNMNSSISQLYPKQNGASGGYGGQNFSSTGVFEYFYDFAINKWLDFVPDAQYIINPAGNGSCVNALVLGATISAKF